MCSRNICYVYYTIKIMYRLKKSNYFLEYFSLHSLQTSSRVSSYPIDLFHNQQEHLQIGPQDSFL